VATGHDDDDCQCGHCLALDVAIDLVAVARRRGDREALASAQRQLQLAAAAVDRFHGLTVEVKS
jgi:hypothetical protein